MTHSSDTDTSLREILDDIKVEVHFQAGKPVEYFISTETAAQAIHQLMLDVIGSDPDYGDKQPLWVQKIEKQVCKVKRAQRERLEKRLK